MSIVRVKLPNRSFVLRLKLCAYAVLTSSLWYHAFSVEMSDERALRIAGLRHRRDFLKTIATLLGARTYDLSICESGLPSSRMWTIVDETTDGPSYHGGSELDVLEFYLAVKDAHPDGPATRWILHGDGSTLRGRLDADV